MIKLEVTISLFSFIILCMSSIFVHSLLFTDSYIVPKWLFTILITLGLGIFYSVRLLLNKPIKINTSMMGSSISIICFILAIYGILQYFNITPSHSEHKAIGNYDNPAGFACSLCAGLPFISFLILKTNPNYIRYTGWAMAIIITIAVILSHSRAGIISITMIVTTLVYQRLKQKRVLKLLLLTSIFLLLLFCYCVKKDSADGRLLIWQCGLDMVKDAPWMGHGIGSFEAHYMDYQAKYFQQHKWSRFSILADNVKQPFNEYLKVLLNFGIIGLVVLLALIKILIYCYKKNPSTEKKTALYVLISIGTFCLFSYPFTYPFVWIISLLCIFMMSGEYLKRYLHSTGWMKNIFCLSIFICSLVGIHKLVKRIKAEITWNTIAMSGIWGSNNKSLLTYTELNNELGDNPYFLYNYAAVLLERQRYEESLQIALKCRQYWADYNLELIIGENYQQKKHPIMAEKYYKSASNMCPCRFLPLQQLFYLYSKNGKEEQAISVAKVVINKPMKIATPNIQIMKKKMIREVYELSAKQKNYSNKFRQKDSLYYKLEKLNP